jgi:hypothetical protein
MATPADQRLLELLEKWLKSLELHLRYSSLDSDSYSKIQPWPEHQRPSRWIIDLAVQKAVALRTQIEERVKLGDTKFSDSLELMTFLANLIGSEHIERFIPLASPANERVRELAPPDGQPQDPPPETATATREMPEFVASKRQAAPVGTGQVARTERKPSNAKPAPRTAPKQPARLAAPVRPGAHGKPAAPAKPAAAPKPPAGTKPAAATGAPLGSAAREQVVADAARLMQWGRKWYELAELIARMADRPPLAEVRRILKENKMAIDKMAGQS